MIKLNAWLCILLVEMLFSSLFSFLLTSLSPWRGMSVSLGQRLLLQARKDFMRYEVFLRKWDFSNSVHPQNEISLVYYVNCGGFFFLPFYSQHLAVLQTLRDCLGKKTDHKEFTFIWRMGKVPSKYINLANLFRE